MPKLLITHVLVMMNQYYQIVAIFFVNHLLNVILECITSVPFNCILSFKQPHNCAIKPRQALDVIQNVHTKKTFHCDLKIIKL